MVNQNEMFSKKQNRNCPESQGGQSSVKLSCWSFANIWIILAGTPFFLAQSRTEDRYRMR
jgi:hypothetical protein